VALKVYGNLVSGEKLGKLQTNKIEVNPDFQEVKK
jgi:hypothetical protein